MAWTGTLSRRERATTAAVVVGLHLALGWALLTTRGADVTKALESALDVILIEPLPPPLVSPSPPERRSERKSGEAAPPDLVNKPAPIVAPPPIIPPIAPPPPVVTAPVAGAGAAPEVGAASVPGPGPGAGGIGTGRGGGGAGEGDDDGYTPPRQIRGRLRNSDYPQNLGVAGVGGRVSVRYLVETDGRVTECEVTRSSGNAELDATTCRLITERFRFRPSRDGRGRPVASYVVENHSWVVE
jgi:periplasmic protein TonB